MANEVNDRGFIELLLREVAPNILTGKTLPDVRTVRETTLFYHTDTKKMYICVDKQWREISSPSGGGGSFSGTLDDISDGVTYKRVTQAEKSYWNSKANATHTHFISDVANLQSALDSKASITHNHTLSSLLEKSYNSLTDKPNIPSDDILLIEGENTPEFGAPRYIVLSNYATGNMSFASNPMVKKVIFVYVISIKPEEGFTFTRDNGFIVNGVFQTEWTLTENDNGKFYITYTPVDDGVVTVNELHSHLNFSLLNSLVTNGSGNLFLADDGTYKAPPTGSSYNVIQAMREQPFYFTDFWGTAGATTVEAAYPFDLGLISSGTQAKIAGEPNHWGILRISSSTTANSGGYVMTDIVTFRLAGNEYYEFCFQHRVAGGTNTLLRAGFLDTLNSADATDGVYFEVPANSLAIVGKTANNGVRSTTPSSLTLTINTWYRGVIFLNDNATQATFQIYSEAGNLLWSATLNTNIPTAAGRETGAGFVITNSGTTATLLGYFDYVMAGLSGARKLIR